MKQKFHTLVGQEIAGESAAQDEQDRSRVRHALLMQIFEAETEIQVLRARLRASREQSHKE